MESNTQQPEKSDKVLAFESLWKKRILRCQMLRAVRLKEAKAVRDALAARNVKRAAQEAEKEGVPQIVAQYPKMQAYVNSLLPNVLARNPVSRVAPKDMEEESQEFAVAGTKLLEVTAAEQRRVAHARQVARDILETGLGVFLHEFDDRKHLAKASRMNPALALWDADGTSAPGTCRWVGREVVVPLDSAREEFNAPWLEGDTVPVSPDRLSQGLDAYENYPFDIAGLSDGERAALQEPAEKTVRLAIVWMRAEKRDENDVEAGEWCIDDEKPPKEDGTQPRKMVLVCRSGELLAVRKWGFVLGEDEFPLTFMRGVLSQEFWPESPLSQLVSMQTALTAALSFNITRAAREAASVYGFTPEACNNPDVVKKGLVDGMDSLIVELKQGAEIKNVLGKIDMGQLSPVMVQSIDMINAAWNDVTNYDALFRADSSLASTATGAEISEQRKQTAVASLGTEIDEGMKEVCAKDMQISMSRMSKKMVKRRIGEYAKGWKDNATVDEIRSVDVQVEPGSMAQGADEAKAQNILEGQAKANEAIAVCQGMGVEFDPVPMCKAQFEPLRQWARYKGMLDFYQLLEKMYETARIKPPPPPPEPAPVMEPAPMVDPMMGAPMAPVPMPQDPMAMMMGGAPQMGDPAADAELMALMGAAA